MEKIKPLNIVNSKNCNYYFNTVRSKISGYITNCSKDDPLDIGLMFFFCTVWL